MNKYQIITYDHSSGADEKQEYPTRKAAQKEARAYYRTDSYEGVCIYNLETHRVTDIWGSIPTASMPSEY